MATRRIRSKKGKRRLIFSIMIGVLVTSSSGYLLWRVNLEETLGTVFIRAYNYNGGSGGSYGDVRYKDSSSGSTITVSAHRDTSPSNTSNSYSGTTIVAAKAATKSIPGYYVGVAKTTGGKYEVIQVKYGTPTPAPAPAKTSSSTPTPAPTPTPTVTTTEDTNLCDGGAWVESPPETTFFGSEFTISGYGQDSDGIDPTSVSITIDGEAVDNADASVNVSDSTKTDWVYAISGLEEGDHTVTVAWKDTEGLGGSDCTITSSFSIEEIPTNPNWGIEKTGTPVLNEGTTDDLDVVEILYIITITNTGDGEGFVENIVDTLDEKVKDSFLDSGSVTNSGEYLEGVITWSPSGEGVTFDPGESKTYQYKLVIPRESFGTYGNTVVATPTEGDPFSVTINVQATGSLVQTGIFEDASKSIAIGFGFLALGMLYMKFDFVKLAWNGVESGRTKIVKRIKQSKKESKKKKISSLRDKFESRFLERK